uniref:Integrase catalytic domain-containing protein n=1 Tax=Tanacetum cinerariifolium TaxID=118510 RepID=A0A699HF37_TANCI|nr:hypothetical protein [Tanacetum cinerariifolium]
MSYLIDYEEIDGGYAAFGGNPKGWKITRKSLMKKMYCLLVIDDYSRFTWVFFLSTKDKTSGILKSFITRIENLVDQKVKVIRCDNRTEFKNRELNQFCEMKEAVNTACYVQNRVLVVKPHKKTPYELFYGRTPTLSFMRPFGCLVTILNTKDHLGKFNGKANEGFFIGYSLNSKAFRVFNSKTRLVEENLHIRFSESTANVVSSGPKWLFDIDALKRTMNYKPIVAGTQSNGFDDGYKPSSDDEKKVDEDLSKENECNDQEKEDNVNSTNNVNTVSSTVNAAGTNTDNELPFDPNMSALEDVSAFDFSNKDEDDDVVDDMNDLDITIQVSPTPTIRIYKDHLLDQVLRDLHLATQTRKMIKNLEEHGLGYNVVPTPYIGNFMPPKPDLFGLKEFTNKFIVSEPTVKKPVVKTSEDKPKVVRKNFGPSLIEDLILDSEDEAVLKSKIEKETVKPSFKKTNFVKCNEQVKSPRKTNVKQAFLKIRNVESTVDITKFVKKLKFVCHWANPFKDLKWSNVPGVKLFSLFELDDTFLSLQTMLDLNYHFGGFMDYLWSYIGTPCRETISFIYNLVRVSILSVSREGMKCADLVRWATMTQIVSCSMDVLGSFVMKSIIILSYFHVGISGCTIAKLTLGLLPIYTSYFSGVNMNSLIIKHVFEKLHDTDPEITFGELGIQFLLSE